MIAAVFILIVLGIAVFPMLIPYLLSGYMVLDGIGNRQFIYNLKVSTGGANVFLPDLLYAAAVLLAMIGITKLFFIGKIKSYAPLSKLIIFTVFGYLLFFVAKILMGYFDSVPLDSLVRRFALDTQCIYLFVPLLYLKKELTLKHILYFIVFLSLVFPLAQPFLYGSADQVYLEKGQGTLRLGFGNANLLLMLGILAFFVWERRIWLSALPLAGIAMLAQRSAFISLTLCVFVISLQKKKVTKFMSMLAVTGLLLVVALFVIQSTMSIPIVDKVVERFTQTFEKTGTTKARLDVIPVALEEFSKRPWVGFGYSDIYRLQKKQTTSAFAFNMLHPHNFILSSLLRTGIIGTLLIFIIIALVLLAAYRLTRDGGKKKQGLYLFSSMLFFTVFGIMNTSFISAGYVFWILVGISLWYLNDVHYNKTLQRETQ